MASITIRGNVLDPAKPGNIALLPDVSKTKYVLVQLKNEMSQSSFKILKDNGLEPFKRMDGNTWLCHHTTSDFTKVRGLSIVQYVLAYLAYFKVHLSLKTPTTTGSGKDIRSIAIVLHEGVTSSDDALNQIKKFSSPEVLAIGDRLLQLKIDRQALDQIAQLDQVQAIEELKQAQIHNDMIRDIVGVDRVNMNQYIKQALLPTGAGLLTGAGEVVAVADTGLDYHHEAFKDAIVQEYAIDRQAETMDNNGHGTHVAGTILGREVKTSIGDSNVGVAPGAGLVVQSILSTAFPGAKIPPFNLTDLLTTPYNNNKVRIHNNSWGISIMNDKNGNRQLPYTALDAEILDQIAIDHPDLLIVFSAGNDGVLGAHCGTIAQIGAHAAAKNVLTVGATQSKRPVDVGPAPFYMERYNFKGKVLQPTSVPGFSSKGPTVEGRTKPDVVAPGVCILSARTASPLAKADLAMWEKLYGLPPDTTDKVIYCTGTSMAAPAISGCAALVREALRRLFKIELPSSALMKALLINGTLNLGLPATAQGYGLVSMDHVINPLLQQYIMPGSGAGFWQDMTKFENPNIEVAKKTVVPPISTVGRKANLKATLCYIDSPGHLIQRKVSLVVEDKVGSRTVHGWNASVPSNVQQIVLENLKPGQEVVIKMVPDFALDVYWAMVWDFFET